MKTNYLQYPIDVLEGKVIAGQNIKLACQRFQNDLKRTDIYLNTKVVDKAIKFISCLRHFKGKSSGQQFILEPWQAWIVANIVGWYRIDTKTRRFTSSYIEVSRKNGKSALAAALCMFFLLADGEDGAEVDLAANSKEQAKIAYEFCQAFAKQLDPKTKYLRTYRDKIFFDLNNSKLNVFAADDSKLDGFNASFALIDKIFVDVKSL